MIWIVALVSCGASALTLVSGFGLGTLLLPVYAFFLPLPIAVASTAIVHLANNLFKLGLMGRYANARVALRFGLPAALGAYGGARLLVRLADAEPLWRWSWAGRDGAVTPLGLVLGGLVGVFAVLELVPRFESLRLPPRWVELGGVLSGFFGGLSGHQGALRAAFLTRLGLSRDAFIATSIVCAILVDIVRLTVYGVSVLQEHLHAVGRYGDQTHVVAATLAAFVGAVIGRRLLRKMTLAAVHRVVGVLLLVVSAAIATGWI